MKILVTRTDRLGDLALSLPVFDFLAASRPDWQLHAMVAPGHEALVAGHPGVGRVWTWTDTLGEADLAALRRNLAAEGYAAALMLQYRRELAWLLRRVKIARVHGPWSKPSSWFLLNRGTCQRRSLNRRHETDYNLELAGRLAGMPLPAAPLAPRIILTDTRRRFGLDWRAAEAGSAARVVLIHPGSGGSALDWAPANYAATAGRLAAEPGVRVFITGAAADADTVRAVAKGLDPRVQVLLARFSLGQFLGVLAAADLMIAPSTGPLHLAAGVGIPTVGIFPPVPGMGPGRWGQRGPQAVHLVPQIRCPQQRRCTREACPAFNCLDTVAPDLVAARALAILGGNPSKDLEKEEHGIDQA